MNDLVSVALGLRLLAVATAAFSLLPIIAWLAGATPAVEALRAMREPGDAVQVVMVVMMVVAIGSWLVGLGAVLRGFGEGPPSPRVLLLVLAIVAQLAAVSVFSCIGDELDSDVRKATPMIIGVGGFMLVLPSLAFAALRWPWLRRPKTMATGLLLGTLALVPWGLTAIRLVDLPLSTVATTSALTIAIVVPTLELSARNASRARP